MASRPPASSATNGSFGSWHRHHDGQASARQIGTYASQRRALAAAREFRANERSTERGTISWLVRRYVDGKSDITPKAREQYRWAIPHIESEFGAIPLSRLDRDDVARWINMLADGGKLSRRSVQICRNVRRASLADAVEEGLIPRSPAASVPSSTDSPTRQRRPGGYVPTRERVQVVLIRPAGAEQPLRGSRPQD